MSILLSERLHNPQGLYPCRVDVFVIENYFMRIFHCKLFKEEKLISIDVIETHTMVYIYDSNPKNYGLIEPLSYMRVIYENISLLKCYR